MQEKGRKRKNWVDEESEEETCCLNPTGFRFRPTEQELISCFLYNRVTNNISHSHSQSQEFIQDYDLYGSTEPWQIWDIFGGPCLEENNQGKDSDLDLYFFTFLKNVSSKGSNFSRRIGSGSWQGEAKPKKIYANNNCIGSMRRLRYENKNIPLQHGGWIMHEFSLQGSTLPSSSSTPMPSDFVVCPFRKNDKTHKRQKLNQSENQGKVEDDHQSTEHTRGDDSFSSSSCLPASDDQTIGQTEDDNFSSSSCLPTSSSMVYNGEPIEANGYDRFSSLYLPTTSSSMVYNNVPIEASGDDKFFSPYLPTSSSVQDMTDLFTDEEILLIDSYTVEELLQGLPQPEMQENWAGDDMLTASSIISYEELLTSSYSM